MIVLLIMLVAIFYFVNKNIDNIYLRKKINLILIFSMIFQLLLFIIYRIDLVHHDIDVYYSDATDYWTATLNILNGLTTNQYNATYYITCAFIQRTSPFVWVGWNNIFNILCVDLSIVLCTIAIYKKAYSNSNYKNVILFLILNLFNPLIYYSLMRNLKDAEFLLLTILIGTGLQNYLDKKKISTFVFYILELILCTYLLYGIRPWGFLIGAIPLLIMLFKKGKQKYETITLLILILITIALLPYVISKFKYTVEMWAPIVMQSATDRGVVGNFLGIFKLLFGPGPIRSIYGSQYFLYYLPTGNIMCFLGSTIWWLEIFMLSFGFLGIKNKKTYPFFWFLLMFLITYFLIYIMQYGGSTELRFRGVLYVSLSAFLLSIDGIKFRKQNVIVSFFVFVLMILVNLLV